MSVKMIKKTAVSADLRIEKKKFKTKNGETIVKMKKRRETLS